MKKNNLAKFLLLSSVLCLSLTNSNITYWAEVNNSNGWSQSNVMISNSDNNWAVPIFCGAKTLPDWSPKEYRKGESHLVTPRVNKLVIEIYRNSYWRELNESVSSDDIWEAWTWRDHTNTASLQALESHCQAKRAKSRNDFLEVNGVYTQAKFLDTYYSRVPKVLKQGSLPLPLIGLIEMFNTLIVYAIVLSVMNIIFWATAYTMTQDGERKVNIEKHIKLAFWYFLIIMLVRFWVLWSILAIIWYEGIDMFKFFFFL